MPSRQPHQRHTIGDDQVSGLQCASKSGIVPRFGDAVHSCDRNVPASHAAPNPMLDPRDNVRDLHGVHRDP